MISEEQGAFVAGSFVILCSVLVVQEILHLMHSTVVRGKLMTLKVNAEHTCD